MCRNAFIQSRKEIVVCCDPKEAYKFYEEVEANSIYCNHAEVEDHIVLRPTHQILDAENKLYPLWLSEGITSTTLSLSQIRVKLEKIRLNWSTKGQKQNEAYIHLPAKLQEAVSSR